VPDLALEEVTLRRVSIGPPDEVGFDRV